jgi:hypothetical protein
VERDLVEKFDVMWASCYRVLAVHLLILDMVLKSITMHIIPSCRIEATL